MRFPRQVDVFESSWNARQVLFFSCFHYFGSTNVPHTNWAAHTRCNSMTYLYQFPTTTTFQKMSTLTYCNKS